MFEKLEQYLQEIHRYLVENKESQEILAEIRSNILEKTASRFGQITEDNVCKIIIEYGSSKKVAEGYVESSQLIHPVYKKHLLLYSLLLIGLNLLLAILAIILKSEIVIFPLFIIPKMKSLELLLYLPVIIFYNLGLVGTLFYLISQKKQDIRLPWPVFLKSPAILKEYPKPKPINLILLCTGFIAVLFVYFKFDTLFIQFHSPSDIHSLLEPSASFFYSWLLIVLYQIGIIQYLLRYISRNNGLRLFNSTTGFIFFLILLNQPVKFSLVNPKLLPEGLGIFFRIILFVLTLLFLLKTIRILWVILAEKTIGGKKRIMNGE